MLKTAGEYAFWIISSLLFVLVLNVAIEVFR